MINIKKLKDNYFVKYTVLFAFTAYLVFSWYIFSGKSLIWKNDGWMQVYRAALFYSESMRNAIKDLILHGKWSFPYWGYNFGEGDDTVTSLAYYAVGDPFTFLYTFVPYGLVYVAYWFMSLLRLYMAGVNYSLFCFEVGKKRDFSVLAGAIVYDFCYWGLLNAARHPYFINAMLMLPLVMMGAERLIKNKGWKLLTLSVAMMALMNFYHVVFVAVGTAVYVVIRLVLIYKKDVKTIALKIIRTGFVAGLGMLMACVTLLPTYMVLVTNPRMGKDNVTQVLYPWSHYRKLPMLFLSSGNGVYNYWVCMGFAAPVLVALILLLVKKAKGNSELIAVRLGWLVCLMFLTFPIVGRATNGFTYVANRWSFSIAMVAAYTVTAMWPYLLEMTKKEKILVGAGVAGSIILVSLLKESREPMTYSGLIIAAITYLLMLDVGVLKKMSKARPYILLTLVVFSVFMVSFWLNSKAGENYVGQAKSMVEARDGIEASDAYAAKTVKENHGDMEFSRFGSERLTLNAGLNSGISSIQHYWSIGNTAISAYRQELALADGNSYNYKTLDRKAILMALTDVGYYTIPTGWDVKPPYGYEYLDTIYVPYANVDDWRYDVYKSENALPLGYTYDGYILKSDWDKYTPEKRQEAMLESVVLENAPSSVKSKIPSFDSKVMDYTVECSPEVTQVEGGFRVDKDKGEITLRINGLDNSETYLYAESIDYEPFSPYDWYQKKRTSLTLNLKTDQGTEGLITYRTGEDIHYEGRDSYMENIGYSEKGVNEITVKFKRAGVYTFSRFEVYCQPMDNLKAKTDALRAVKLENAMLGTNEVTGTISSSDNRLLCMSIPYNKGWKAYIDGKETVVYRANIKNMVIEVPTGDHEISFKYHPPYLMMGGVISILSFLIFLGAYIIVDRPRFFKKKQESVKADA